MTADLAATTALIPEITLENKIGEGMYREVYQEGSLAIKVLKHYIRKDYGLFHLYFPTSLYTMFKFLIKDFNEFECDNYRRMIDQIPTELRDSFAKIIGVVQYEGRSISINELVTNIDGNVSKTLRQYGKVKNSGFWKRLGELEELFISEGIPYLDIHPENILVKELKNGDILPVFVDYKRVATKTYPFQFNLLFRSEIARKIKRKFFRIRREYQASS